jgi:hypothetical protein
MTRLRPPVFAKYIALYARLIGRHCRPSLVGCHTHAHRHLNLADRNLERFSRYLQAQSLTVSRAAGMSVSISDGELPAAQSTE